MSKDVLIIGTGLGGLATGLRLATRGYKIIFIEKESQPGGRLNQIKKEGFTFDIGPSFFSMPYEFEEFVKNCGIKMPFEFNELDPIYTVHFKGSNKRFTLYKNIDKLSAQFENIEPNFKSRFISYLNKCKELYWDTIDIVIKRNFDSVPEYLKSLIQVNPKHFPVLFKTFWKQTGKYFKSKEARQIISLIAFFLGRTPFDTNAVYTLLSYIEFLNTGYYNVKNGMYTIVQSIVNELKKLNALFYYNTEIVDFKSDNNKLTALIDQNGNKWEADIFVINSDAAFFRGNVLKRKQFSEDRLRKMNWTMGYLTIYLGISKKLPQVEHHNYFLGDNYEEYSKDIMVNPYTLEKPYYYVNVLSKNNNCAPIGSESLIFVCPVPNLLYKPDWSDKEEIVNSIIKDFSERIGENISDKIVVKLSYTPEDWQNKFNLYKGAGLGLSHKLNQIGAFRPKNYDEIYRNTFYVGASTIPGAGLPMSIISSKLVVERICNYAKDSKQL